MKGTGVVAVIGGGAFACGVGLYLLLAHGGHTPPPLFHNYIVNDRGGYSVRPYRTMRDRRGNYAFVDRQRNMFVLVVTGDSSFTTVQPPQSDRETAVILPNTKYAVTLKRSDNSLTVALPNGQVCSFALGNGYASHWYSQLALID
jgi:hypothetical protein